MLPSFEISPPFFHRDLVIPPRTCRLPQGSGNPLPAAEAHEAVGCEAPWWCPRPRVPGKLKTTLASFTHIGCTAD